MHIVTIHEAKTHLSKLIKEVENGEEVIVAKGKTPKVRLVLVEEANEKRVPGGAEGLIVMSDDFDEPIADMKEYM